MQFGIVCDRVAEVDLVVEAEAMGYAFCWAFDTPMLRSNPFVLLGLAAGRYLLIAFNDPSGVTVHPLGDDGAIGTAITQPPDLDVGIFAHQILTTPSNRAAILVTHGNDATADEAEDPGC